MSSSEAVDLEWYSVVAEVVRSRQVYRGAGFGRQEVLKQPSTTTSRMLERRGLYYGVGAGTGVVCVVVLCLCIVYRSYVFDTWAAPDCCGDSESKVGWLRKWL